MLSEPLAYDTSIKVNMTHNISSIQMAEVRLDLSMTVFQVKLQVEKRYGSDANFVSLTLKDKSGNVVHRMNNDGAIFGTYQPRDGYIIHVTDSNPNSVLKGITQPPFLGLEDVNSVQKFQLTEEQYNKLPDSFRKFRQQIIQQQQTNQPEKSTDDKPAIDDDFEKDIAITISILHRCKVLQGDHRGTVRYGTYQLNILSVGTVPQMGLGYFVGVQLDEPYGTNNGCIKGFIYFQCPSKYGIFVRPSELEVGDFPETDLDDEI